MKARGGRRRLAWHAVAFGLALLGPAARASDSSRVLVEGSHDDPVMRRVVAELRSSGLVVVEVEGSASDAPAAADRAVVGALVGIGPGSGIRVWRVNPSGARVGEPEVLGAHPGDDAAVAAVRAAEIVRARLLPADLPSPAPPALPAAGPPDVDAVRSAPAPAKRSRFGLGAGGLALFSPGGVPPALNLALMVRWLPSGPLVFRGLVAMPAALPTLSSAEGQASVSEWLLGGAVEWSLLAADSPWDATLGLGAAAAHIQTHGEAVAPFVSAGGDGWTSLPFVFASANRSLGVPYVRAGVQLLVGTTAPTVAIGFAGRQVAKWGGVLVGSALGLEVEAY